MSEGTSRVGLVAIGAVFLVAFLAVIVAVVPSNDNPRPVATATTAGGATPAPGETPDTAALVAQGKDLAASLGCTACHSTDGSTIVGPTWKGLAGSQVELADGTTVTADTAYLKESITDPDKAIVKGFAPGIMSGTVQAQMATITSGNNLDALVAYIESIE